jgi:hypothetical protein
MKHNFARYQMSTAAERDHLRLVWQNNPECMEHRDLVLANNPRGLRPDNNPHWLDDMLRRCIEAMASVERSGLWESAAATFPALVEMEA